MRTGLKLAINRVLLGRLELSIALLQVLRL
jgi:hypothetical protein